MVGINKFSDKERRKARRSFQFDRYKEDLRTPKYREKAYENKRKKYGRDYETEDGFD